MLVDDDSMYWFVWSTNRIQCTISFVHDLFVIFSGRGWLPGTPPLAENTKYEKKNGLFWSRIMFLGHPARCVVNDSRSISYILIEGGNEVSSP